MYGPTGHATFLRINSVARIKQESRHEHRGNGTHTRGGPKSEDDGHLFCSCSHQQRHRSLKWIQGELGRGGEKPPR